MKTSKIIKMLDDFGDLKSKINELENEYQALKWKICLAYEKNPEFTCEFGNWSKFLHEHGDIRVREEKTITYTNNRDLAKYSSLSVEEIFDNARIPNETLRQLLTEEDLKYLQDINIVDTTPKTVVVFEQLPEDEE